jgi:hypothetical protein
MNFAIAVIVIVVAIALLFWIISIILVALTPVRKYQGSNQAAPSTEVFFRLSGGVELFVRKWVPAVGTQRVIMGLHGLGQHSGYHHLVGEAMAERGIAYYAMDIRGNGFTKSNPAGISARPQYIRSPGLLVVVPTVSGVEWADLSSTGHGSGS